MEHDRIAVVDFGGQYAHLIATKVRRLHVRTDIVDPLAPTGQFAGYRGLILSGSPALSAVGEGADYNHGIFDLQIPILGLCFGHQEIAKHYGGQVEHTKREYGFSVLHIVGESPIFRYLGPNEVVWMSHGDSVTTLPEGFLELGYSTHVAFDSSGNAPPSGADLVELTEADLPVEHRFAAIASHTLRRYGFQFHPEVDDTENGDEMLHNFAVGICGCRPTWTIQNYIDDVSERIREQVGDRHVFLLVSGGVDSTVCARLLVEALGPDRIDMLHIDNGLMRKDESRHVVRRFQEWGIGDNLHFVDATDAFLDALHGLTEPEDKRLAVGNTFIDVCEREMERLDLHGAVLAQGTIYPDTIETGGTSRADVIKTHHNRVPMIEDMIRAGRVLEPLKDLYKVEVRELGEDLGIDHDFLYRQPFPGPGLGVRLICSPEGGLEPATMADLARITTESRGIARAFGLGATAIPVRSVGVKGDLRAYEWPVLLCEVEGDEPARGHGEDWAPVLEAANRIYREVSGVNRCLYDSTVRKESPHLEPLAAGITRSRLDILREADAFTMEALAYHGVLESIWQCPTIALPVSVDGGGRELVVVRPVLSERAMTARPARLPADLLANLRASVLALPGVSGFAVDVTTKPPGTIEWE